MDVCANLEAKNESKVLVLYTGKWRPSYYKIKRDLIVMFFYYFVLKLYIGGTIGMMRNENGGKNLLVFTLPFWTHMVLLDVVIDRVCLGRV